MAVATTKNLTNAQMDKMTDEWGKILSEGKKVKIKIKKKNDNDNALVPVRWYPSLFRTLPGTSLIILGASGERLMFTLDGADVRSTPLKVSIIIMFFDTVIPLVLPNP